ncbi:MAG: beta strand repeat-containing protein [Flavobacteriales bacterium]
MTCSTFSLNAVRHFLFVLSLLPFTGSRAQTDILPTSVDVRLMQGADPDQLVVQIKTHSTADYGGIISALTITVRYDATSGATLGNGTSFCNAWSPFPPSPTVVNAGMAYRTYNGFGANRLEDPLGNGGCATSLVPEQWFTITTIAVLGTGCTAFTLGNDDWTAANNRDFYLSMAGQNVTGAVLGGAVNGGDCALDCEGVAGGPAQPGTACDDGNANTSNDQWSSSCVCIGTLECTPPAITGITSNAPICAGSNLSLGVDATGTVPLSYTWSGTGNFSPNAYSANVIVSGTASGSYQVTVSNGCGNASTSVDITLNNPPNASIAYSGSPYCTGNATASVTRTGSSGGTYTATPAGLSINPSNGSITLGTSSVGTYTVTYGIAASGGCSAFSTTAIVTVNNPPNASIAYAGSPYCNGSGIASVTRIGTPGGTYSATPSGLSINPSNGSITLGSSSEGTYTVTYSLVASSGCAAFSTTATVTVNNAPNAGIVYTGSPYCTGSGTAGVARTGSAGGTYSATPAGLSINPANGSIYLGGSNAGTYTVGYSIGASEGCSAFSTTATVSVNEASNANIAYDGSPFCTGGGMQEVARIGTAGGIYTASPAGIALDTSIGNIDLGSSAAGVYTVTYSIAANGGCSAFSAFATVEVGNASNALIAYPGSPYCNGDGTATVVRWGSSGGTYSAVPSGLVINVNNGTLSLGTSNAGTYTVTYSIAAGDGCPAFSTTTTVVISDLPDAVIVYAGSPFCGVTAAGVTRTGTAGGTYTAAPAGLVINANTGAINLVNSMPGNYTVAYAIAGGGGCAAFSTSATVTLNEETTWYFDADGDGMGVLAGSVVACVQPAGYVPTSGDGCPNDPGKVAPGACGCGIPDVDTDSDGAPDCIDGCPTDPGKIAPGACGCGISDTDTDADGLPDCIDNCPGLNGVIGDACDDGNSTTVMDIITADCLCEGTITTGIHGAAEELGMILWPNPTADRAFTIRVVHANVGGTVDLFVRDASGRQIYARTGEVTFTREIAVQLPQGTASGSYIVEVWAGDEMTRIPLMCR